MPDKTDPIAPWLHSLGKKYPDSIHPGLDRIREVARRMDLITSEALVVTVAGTNGKGSTVCMLDHIYRAAGYRVGCYTSPHLLHFNERISCNGQQITDEQLITAFKRIAESQGEVFLSYFEIATLAALYHFKQLALDIIILEVGMGGRLDACNVLAADIAVITSIALDHTRWLGSTLEEIAAEKIGVARAGRAVVYGDDHTYESVCRKIDELGCPLYRYGHDFCWNSQSNTFQSGSHKLIFDSSGSLHYRAIANALMVVQIAARSGFPVSHAVLQNAINVARLSGRRQWLGHDPVWLLDVAHNEAAVALLAETVASRAVKGKVRAVFSAMADKDLTKLIQPMTPLVNCWYISKLNDERAVEVEVLQSVFASQGVQTVRCCSSVGEALSVAREEAGKDDLILVYGSFLTVAAAMERGVITGETYEACNG